MQNDEWWSKSGRANRTPEKFPEIKKVGKYCHTKSINYTSINFNSD